MTLEQELGNDPDKQVKLELIQRFIAGALENLKKDGEVLPICTLITANSVQFVAPNFKTAESKTLAMNELRDLSRQINAQFSLFIGEAYSLKTNNPETLNLRPSDDPESVESVIFIVETTRSTFIAFAPILQMKSLKFFNKNIRFEKILAAKGCLLNIIEKSPVSASTERTLH